MHDALQRSAVPFRVYSRLAPNVTDLAQEKVDEDERVYESINESISQLMKNTDRYGSVIQLASKTLAST